MVAEYADVLQIGARNMQNYQLLEAVGDSGKPVLLKRGPSATIDELLLAAEYILDRGNPNVMLCERGIRTFEDHTRFTLPLATVPYLHDKTHLPVVVDPTHGTGKSKLVVPMARAAVAAGADGLIIEVHDDPEHAVSDGAQIDHAGRLRPAHGAVPPDRRGRRSNSLSPGEVPWPDPTTTCRIASETVAERAAGVALRLTRSPGDFPRPLWVRSSGRLTQETVLNHCSINNLHKSPLASFECISGALNHEDPQGHVQDPSQHTARVLLFGSPRLSFSSWSSPAGSADGRHFQLPNSP